MSNMEDSQESNKSNVDLYFEEDYKKVKPIFEIIIPYIKQNGWKYEGIGKDAGKIYSDKDKQLTTSQLETKIEDHYFEYNFKIYEKECPTLEKMPVWYLSLRDFVQRWRFHNFTYSKRVAQKLDKDFEDYLYH
jgi:hypothetical protein